MKALEQTVLALQQTPAGIEAEKTLVFEVAANARALQEMLHLWTRYAEDENIEFPRGKAGLRDVFDNLIDIHVWGHKERIEETGIQDVWNEDLKDPDIGNVRCEIELFYRRQPEFRKRNEDGLRTTEAIPDDILLVDKIYMAVRRLFEFSGNASPYAPTIIGIEARQFDRAMSPLARLLDWLSFK